MTKANGYVIYRGPSKLDGAPIVVIATGFAKASNNEKTGGGLIQTWILREDVSPTDAVNTGADASICGSCPHRGTVEDGRNVGRSCYVTVFQAPLNIWRTFHKGGYPVATDLGELFRDRLVRLGSYGDPATVPVEVWRAVMANTKGGTGYTHQWRTASLELAQWCMASADSEADRVAAKMFGYRTFRVRAVDAPKMQGEITCAASKEGGYKTTCDLCKACGGLSAKARIDVVIAAHGSAAKVNAHARRLSA